jgi:hypothetical protein
MKEREREGAERAKLLTHGPFRKSLKLRLIVWIKSGSIVLKYTSPRQFLKCFGLQALRGRAQIDLTVLKKMPPSRPSWPRADGNKHIFEGLCRQNLCKKRLLSVTRYEDTGRFYYLV